MQNKVILLTEKHASLSKKGVAIAACRNVVTLRPFEPVEVPDDATARMVMQFAGRAGLHVEIYDGRKHNKLVALHAKELVTEAELEDLDLSQPGMLNAISKQRKLDDAKASPLSREEILTMPVEELLQRCKRGGAVPRQTQSVPGFGGDKKLRAAALEFYGHEAE